MKYIFLFLGMIGLIFIWPQPTNLELNTTTRIEPIVENWDMGPGYWYVRTLKLYYVDSLDSPIRLSDGSLLFKRCSDQTELTFFSGKDSLKVISDKKMSCEIKAWINLERKDIEWLRGKEINKLRIKNLVTDNEQEVTVLRTDYFKRLIEEYNKAR